MLLVDDCDELVALDAVGFDTLLDVEGIIKVVLCVLLYDVL